MIWESWVLPFLPTFDRLIIYRIIVLRQYRHKKIIKEGDKRCILMFVYCSCSCICSLRTIIVLSFPAHRTYGGKLDIGVHR